MATTIATHASSRAGNPLRLAIMGGVEAGLVGAATLLLIRIVVASVLALAVASVSAVVRAFLYVFSTPAGDAWMMRLARSPIWVALKVGAYPFIGERALGPEFDLGVILLSLATQAASSIAWGVLLAVVTVGRAVSRALPVGLLAGIAAWWVNGYVIPSFFGGGQLAAGPALLVEYIPFGLAMAVTFLRYEELHGLEIHRHPHHRHADQPKHWPAGLPKSTP